MSQGDTPSPAARFARPLADLVMALRFFSRLPTGKGTHEKPDLGRIAPVLPLASLAIGAGPAALLFVFVHAGFPALFSALLAVAAAALVTGAMSEDAIADAADGLFGGATSARRLEIMKDSRHGSYGVLAIVFVVGLKVAALAAIAGHNPLAATLVWLAATTMARSGALYLPMRLPPARTDGAAAAAGGVPGNAFALGNVLALVLGLVLAGAFTGIWGFVLASGCAAVVALGWARLCRRLVGGQTGDLTGAAQVLLEIAILGVFMRLIV
ncbi:adenosylcobinamide-GDP ribazoletransferase [Pelagibacterium sediminicola]|uniref:adenosylcobinamide-GDP ribazoletransferase n=1 Tax=Pelagibacterium sediminicola TaxID=2248761 RepID=UPI0018E5234F|nr:adenosylcobinamide-GDP ribazoletransferase [Pelagibacterium sediminicola]